LGRPQNWSGNYGAEKNLLPLPGIESRQRHYYFGKPKLRYQPPNIHQPFKNLISSKLYISSYLTGKTLHLRYKAQPVNAV
jgi:hypothetical protein